MCWSCRLKKSRAIDLTHPSTLPHAGGNDFGGRPDRFARAEPRIGMTSKNSFRYRRPLLFEPEPQEVVGRDQRGGSFFAE